MVDMSYMYFKIALIFFPHVLSSPQLIKINFSAIIKCVKLFIGDDTFLSVPIFQKLSKNVIPFPFSKPTFLTKFQKSRQNQAFLQLIEFFTKPVGIWPLSHVLFFRGEGGMIWNWWRDKNIIMKLWIFSKYSVKGWNIVKIPYGSKNRQEK